MRGNLIDNLNWRRGVLAWAFVLLAAIGGAAQSGDLNAPTPVTTNELNARIAPRDLGDARRTSHFYTFNGTQGDLSVTIESLNLDGVVDLFLASGLRPLTQITLFAGGGALSVTKTVFLRKEETLVLRVQARTPNDEAGTYKIRLAGTFVPAANVAAATTQTETTAANDAPPQPTGRGVRRVNSAGARIEEPVTDAPKPEASVGAAAPETTARETATSTRAPATKRTPTRRGRATGRTETARRTPPASERKPATGEPTTPTETEAKRTETVEPAPVKPETARAPRTKTSRPPRNTRTKEAAKRTAEPTKGTPPAAATTEAAKEAAAPQLGATRLVIEVRDGPKVEHEMSSVNRVTVVNQLIVVVLKNGRTERYPLTNVLRMTIEP